MSANVNKVLETSVWAYCQLSLADYIKLLRTAAFEFISYQ